MKRLGLVLLVVSMLALAACGKPAVRGKVLPVASERTGLPWGRVEVRLVRGQLIKQLSELAARHRSEAMPEVLSQTRSLITTEHSTTADALQQARAALASLDGESDGHAGPANGGDTTSLQSRLSVAEARLATARHDYDSLLTSIAPRIAALGVAADPPARALPDLRAAVQVKVAGEARRLRDEYLRSELGQQTRTDLATERGMDRLCWKGENKRDLGLQFRGATVLFNGEPLPDAVARQIWGLPPKDEPMRIPNSQPADRDVLLPGMEFETCFYARGVALSLDIAGAYGLEAASPTRGGEWRVQWQDITMVAGSVNGKHSPLDASFVFARQIEPFEAGLEETRLIDAITRSAAARALNRAEATLLACHRAIESEEAYQEVERALQGMEEGQTQELVTQARLRPVLQQVLGEPTKVHDWIKRATALVNSSTIASQESKIGQAFEFAGLAPGPYTLLAESQPSASKPKLWVVPIQVKESVELNLEMATARDMTLESMLGDVLTQPQRVPSP